MGEDAGSKVSSHPNMDADDDTGYASLTGEHQGNCTCAVVTEGGNRRVGLAWRPACGGHWTQPLGTGPIRLSAMVPAMPLLLPAVKA